MKVVAVLSQKGGSGKTTLAAHLAVEAEARGYGPVFLADLDPQGSLRSWYERREADTPVLIDPRRTPLGPAVEALQAEGVKLLFVDSPPHGDIEPVVAAASVANLAIIPVRPGILDVEAVAATVEVLQRVDRPGAFVINMARPQHGRVEDAREALKVYGLPIFGAPIVTRADFQDAMIFGKTARELHPKGKAAAEIAMLWNWIRRRI